MDKKQPRGNFLPSLEPMKKDSLKSGGMLPSLNKTSIKAFESNKPVKVVATH